ncbi:flagellar hook assembly protein FlgD [Candidatus Sumerlaeota bacterium]|nr:flagellar hook assembly protein FlgD [Candidatus Sumerlaeota bacterium]
MITSASEALNSLTTTPSTSGSGSTLGQEEFLRLLVTQLESQDPLNPQDSTEFTAQLAQFSALEQQLNTNNLIEQLLTFEAAIANTQAASFIGQEATVYGSEITVQDGEISQAQFNLGSAAEEVTITIRDANGTAVRVITLSDVESGIHDIEWDGANGAGADVADGTYSFSVAATTADETIDVETHITGIVDEIAFETDGTYLVIDGRHVALGNLIAVRAPGSGGVS